MVNQSKSRDPRFWAKWRASGAVGTIPFMEKYQEIAKGFGLDQLFKKNFGFIYERLADISNQVVPGNSARMNNEAEEGLFVLASSAIQVGSTLTKFRKTTRRVLHEGISDYRLPTVTTAASLAYMVDMAVERFNQNGKSGGNNPRILYQALDFLTLDEVNYLGP